MIFRYLCPLKKLFRSLVFAVAIPVRPQFAVSTVCGIFSDWGIQVLFISDTKKKERLYSSSNAALWTSERNLTHPVTPHCLTWWNNRTLIKRRSFFTLWTFAVINKYGFYNVFMFYTVKYENKKSCYVWSCLWTFFKHGLLEASFIV